MTTIFSRIIAGEIPGTFVHRDDRCVAFMSINPLARGHVLVVPIEEIDHWIDASPELVGHLFDVAHRIGRAQQQVFDCERVGVDRRRLRGAARPHPRDPDRPHEPAVVRQRRGRPLIETTWKPPRQRLRRRPLSSVDRRDQFLALVAHVVDVGGHLVHRQQVVGCRHQQTLQLLDVVVGRDRAIRPTTWPAASPAFGRGPAPSSRWPTS